jgi:hypothetical protein
MRTKTAIVAIALAGALAGAGLTFARDAGDQNAVTAEKLIAEALAGDPSKEVTAQLYTFPPGTVCPGTSIPMLTRGIAGRRVPSPQ